MMIQSVPFSTPTFRPAPPARRAALHFGQTASLSRPIRNEIQALISHDRPDLADKFDIPLGEWVAQFATAEDQHLALKLLKEFRYFDVGDVRTASAKQHKWLKQQPDFDLDTTKFTSFAPGKSGGLMLYFYRQANRLPNQSPMSYEMAASPIPIKPEKAIENLVILEDFLGTGREAEYFFKKLAEALDSSEHEYKNIYFLPMIGYEEGVRYVEERFPDIKVHCARTEPKVLQSEHPSFSPKEQAQIAAMLQRYPQVYPADRFGDIASPTGYRDGQALVGFFFNTPSNTLPIFWSNFNGWKPLFPRYDSFNADSGEWRFPKTNHNYWA